MEMTDLLHAMVEADASDLYVMLNCPPLLRVQGVNRAHGEAPLSAEDTDRLAGSLMNADEREAFRTSKEMNLGLSIEGLGRFRVNVLRQRATTAMVIRQIKTAIPTMAELALPEVLARVMMAKRGLILVTGATGSGKSTSLAAMIDHRNRNTRGHIITIEDPVEFVHRNKKCLVNQREVRSHTNSFKDALRAALREDPDIVLVGEMRDLETIAIAIETAETGHLVFGTLHTTTATSTVDRIVDQFPADRQQQIRTMLADSLKGVVAQTLLKKIGGGRVAALEILLTNNAVANLIRDGKTFQLPSILQTSKAQGMRLLNDSLLELVKKGIVEPREAYMKAVDKAGLLGAFKSNNIALPEAAAPEAAPTPDVPPAVAPMAPPGPPGAQRPGGVPGSGRRPAG